METVRAYTAISRKYRDSGHPQFWGRIIGTSADAENQQWLLKKFTDIGLSDVHLQSFDMVPQWMPQSWEVTATGGGKTLKLETAQPSYGSTGNHRSRPRSRSRLRRARQRSRFRGAGCSRKSGAALQHAVAWVMAPHGDGRTGDPPGARQGRGGHHLFHSTARKHSHAAVPDEHERADLFDGHEGRHGLPRPGRHRDARSK